MGRPPILTREQILETARRVFTLKGFEGATLADIAGDLGVTPAALLRHFQSKEDLFDTAMRGHTVTLPQCILDLAKTDASSDPRVVLRRVASEWVPFVERTLSQNLTLQMYDRARHAALVIPFDTAGDDAPPRRGFRIVADYFSRAKDAGVIAVDDPRAAALLFMGSLAGFVFIHHIANALPQPYPLQQYIDSLLELWSRGAIVEPGRGGSRARKESSQADRPASAHRRSRRSAAGVLPVPAQAPKAGPLRNDRGKDGERRVTRRRPRRSGPR
jgi:AcrR family transcriptional regulator